MVRKITGADVVRWKRGACEFMFIPIIAAQQRRYMQAFINAGAISEDTAVRPEEVGVRQNQALRNMIWRKMLIRLPDGRCYIDKGPGIY